MSRYHIGAPPRADDLALDVSEDVLRGMPHKEQSDTGSSSSNYSPYAYALEMKPNGHIQEDKDGSAFANSLISQALNADGTPKRPMNAFMIFARKRRPEVSSANQMMRTGEISKILSKEWNAMDITQKQFYLDQAKRLKDTFNSKYPDYVYRRRPNNSKKKRRTDTSPPEPEDLSGDPSPVDGEEESAQYPFGHQDLPPVADELFTPNSSTLPSHGSYSAYPYPQPTSHRSHHMSLHQQHQQHDFGNPRSTSNGSLSLSMNPSGHSHAQSSLRSAPAYSSHESSNPYQSVSPLMSGNGNGYHVNSSSVTPQPQGYWNGYHERESTHSPHHNISSSSSPNIIQGSMNGHWLPPPVPSTNSQYAQYSGRERAYTTTALPAMKSSFPSPGMNQMQLPLPPMMTSGARSGGRRPSSGGHTSHGGGGHYLPSVFAPNGSVSSPSASSSGGHGYFPSPPSTSSSTSTGTINGGDRILTPPDLGAFDLGRPHGGEISVGYGVWDRK